MSKAVLYRDLIILFQHLNQCYKAGVPVKDAMQETPQLVDHKKLRFSLLDAQDRLAQGQILSEIMADYPSLFSRVLINLVKTGEHTGRLAQSFEYCTQHVSWLDTYRRQIKKMVRYPMIVTGILLVLELVTGGVFIRTTALTLLCIYLFYRILKFQSHKENFINELIDRGLLKLPVIGQWVEKFALAQFASSFGFLYKSGMDINQALDNSVKACTNAYLRLVLHEVRDRVKNGQSLYDSFAQTNAFSSTILRLVKAGEMSGDLGGMFQEIATMFIKDTTDSMDLMIKTVQPVLIIILGIMFISTQL